MQQNTKRSKKKTVKRKLSDDNITIEQFDDDMKNDNLASTQAYNEENEIDNCPSLEIISQNNFIVKGKKGHMNYYSKSTISTGTYYYEVTIYSMDSKTIQDYVSSRRIDDFSKKYYEPIFTNFKNYVPNIRVGFTNTNGDVDLTLGADEYSYGFRASDGMLITDGDCEAGNESYAPGDCIGLLINLKPPMPDFMKNSVNGGSDKNTECYIKFYKNGVEQNKEFRGIFEGSYKAAMTLYNFAKVQINFGPKFKYLDLDEFRHIKCIPNEY